MSDIEEYGIHVYTTAVEQYQKTRELLTELFEKTRDIMFLQASDIYSLQNRIEYHVEMMIFRLRDCQREGNAIGYKFDIFVPTTNITAKEEYDNAFNTLTSLYSYPCIGFTKNTYPIRFLQAKIIAHMKNMVYLNDKANSEKYIKEIVLPWVDSPNDLSNENIDEKDLKEWARENLTRI